MTTSWSYWYETNKTDTTKTLSRWQEQIFSIQIFASVRTAPRSHMKSGGRALSGTKERPRVGNEGTEGVERRVGPSWWVPLGIPICRIATHVRRWFRFCLFESSAFDCCNRRRPGSPQPLGDPAWMRPPSCVFNTYHYRFSMYKMTIITDILRAKQGWNLDPALDVGQCRDKRIPKTEPAITIEPIYGNYYGVCSTPSLRTRVAYDWTVVTQETNRQYASRPVSEHTPERTP